MLCSLQTCICRTLSDMQAGQQAGRTGWCGNWLSLLSHTMSRHGSGKGAGRQTQLCLAG